MRKPILSPEEVAAYAEINRAIRKLDAILAGKAKHGHSDRFCFRCGRRCELPYRLDTRKRVVCILCASKSEGGAQ
jgi:hypothetical protein